MKPGGPLRAISRHSLVCAFACFTAVACGDATAPPESRVSSLRILAGDGQTGRPGEELPDPITVAVLDHLQRPVAGATVSFTVLQGGGNISPFEVRTDELGVARSRWTLGGAGMQQATAAVKDWEGSNLTALFTATAAP